ncbi:MAG: hypothetical protein KBS83_00630 [Lachnospiraceae bacterium]|nr:hypothetical protein [Candidatus Equihabitans merdae]
MAIIDRHIDNYIDQILRHLPFWERNAARIFFRDQINNYLEYMCEGEQPSLRDLRKIKKYLGSPKTVARTYRLDKANRRNMLTPHSEEFTARNESSDGKAGIRQLEKKAVRKVNRAIKAANTDDFRYYFKTILRIMTALAVLCAAIGFISFLKSGTHPLLFILGLIVACGTSAFRMFLPFSEGKKIKKDESAFLQDDDYIGSVYRTDVYQSLYK